MTTKTINTRFTEFELAAVKCKERTNKMIELLEDIKCSGDNISLETKADCRLVISFSRVLSDMTRLTIFIQVISGGYFSYAEKIRGNDKRYTRKKFNRTEREVYEFLSSQM